MQLSTFFRVAAVLAIFPSPVFSLTADSSKIISGIEKVVEQAHNVDTSLSNFDGGTKKAMYIATALFYSQKASNKLQDDLGNVGQLPVEDMPQVFTALADLQTVIIDATETAASKAPLMKSKGYKSYAVNTLTFYASENKVYAKAISSIIPESFQDDVDAMVEVNEDELQNVLALFEQSAQG